MKKLTIIMIIIILLSFISFSFISQTYAVGLDSMGPAELYKNEDGDNTGAINIANIIVGLIRRIGEAVAVLMLMIIGIKYIMGSVQDKAEYKQTMWPYLLGAALIFAGAEITNIIYEMIAGK